jgi:hypothetical protein
MPARLLLAIAFIVLCTIGLGYLLSAENTGRFSWLTGSGSEPQPAMASGSNQQLPQAAAGSDQPPSPSEPSDDALGFMLANVAQQYAENIRYPEYSLPLSDAQAEAYAGNRFEPIALPLPGDGRFTVTLEKFRFVQGEDILVAATVTGLQVVSQRMTSTLERAENRDSIESTELTSSDGYYQGVLTAEGEPGEYRLIVEADIDGDTVRHVSTLTVEPDLGDFTGLGDPDVRNNDLLIPVEFDARESGFYALSAQLMDNGQPIALLSAEKRLETSGNTIDLRAHGSVLAGRNLNGKLQLRHLQIRRLPAQPGDRTDYGYGPDEGYTFTPPDLESLTDTPASDPESEQRAALLQKLADKF